MLSRYLKCLGLVIMTVLSFKGQRSFAAGSAKPKQVEISKEYPEERYEWILETFQRYQKKSKSYNSEYFAFVDFRKHVSERRLYIVYPQNNKAVAYKVAHGYGSDPDQDGYVDLVGDISGSGMSSEGVYVVSGHGSSKKFERKLYLCGLSKTNRKAFSRHILVHPAIQENKDYLEQKKPSAGCFSVNVKYANQLMDVLMKKGTLIIASFTDEFI